MARYRPPYLAHVRVRRWVGGTWRVLLAPEGRPHVPQLFLHRVARGNTDLPPDADIDLGLVAPRAVDDTGPGRPRVTAWGSNRHGHPDDGGSGAYATRREAAESCAVEAIEGHAARQRFNVERARRRRSA